VEFQERLDSEIQLPGYAHAGDAALDLRSAVDVTIPPRERRVVPTGLRVAIPEGFVGLVWDRSGLAANKGIHTMAGVIDSGYRGEIKVVMANFSAGPFHVAKGDRIAQMLVQPVATVRVEEVDELPPSPRGEEGFGSTGMK
jgi:dUTP pyrophosphatase